MHATRRDWAGRVCVGEGDLAVWGLGVGLSVCEGRRKRDGGNEGVINGYPFCQSLPPTSAIQYKRVVWVLVTFAWRECVLCLLLARRTRNKRRRSVFSYRPRQDAHSRLLGRREAHWALQSNQENLLVWPSWVCVRGFVEWDIENYVLGGKRRDVCLLPAAFVRQRNAWRGGRCHSFSVKRSLAKSAAEAAGCTLGTPLPSRKFACMAVLGVCPWCC